MAPDATPFRRLVDSLPVEQGQALDLRIGQRMTLASIAEQMGKTPAQVARLLRQGLGELRDKLP